MKVIMLGVVATAMSALSGATGDSGDQGSLASRLHTNAQVYFADARHVETWHPLDARISQTSPDRVFTMDTQCVFGTRFQSMSAAGSGWNVNITPLEEAGGSLKVRAAWQRVRE